MNAWNQWGAAAYPTPIPGYGAPQAGTATALPAAAAALPPVAAAAAVPYPTMPGFQAWPYGTPQAMAPWGAPSAAAPATQAAAAQWDQWNQWQQQYSQWQQHYAAQTVATTPQTAQAHTTIATPKAGLIPQVPAPVAPASTAVASNTTATASPASSSNVKRASEAPPEPVTEPKKPRVEQSTWNQSSSSTTSKELQELSEAEKQFDEQFKNWEAQFDAWRQQNANHPDIEQYKAYEAKWASWREQLLARREQMKKKREKLTEQSGSGGKSESLIQPPEPSTVLGPSSVPSAVPPIYPGYTAPSATSPAPSNPQFPQSQYQQTQSQFMPPYMNPSAVSISQPTNVSSTQPTTVTSVSGALEQTSSQQSEFLKSSSSNGIPGLDLLSGGTSQAEVKSMPTVSFSGAGQLPIQTPADNKPFDFPPPRQGPGGQLTSYPNQSQLPQPNVAGQSATIPPTPYGGILAPSGIPPTGFPPGAFANQPPSAAAFQGTSQPGGYQGGFPGPTPATPYQNQSTPSSGFPAGVPGTSFQGPPTTGFQSGATPAPGFQSQASSNYQQPPGYPYQAQPPPTGFPPMTYGPPGSYPPGFPQQQSNAPPQQSGFQNQPNQASGFPEGAKGSYPFQQPSGGGAQGTQQYPPMGSQDSKKIPGLMDNVMKPGFGDRPSNSSETGGDNFNRRLGGHPDDSFNKFPDRPGDGNRDRFGDKQGPRLDEPGFGGRDLSYSLPKPKGYFSMQEMSEEEEYEKFHEYQQANEQKDDEEDMGRKKFDPKSKGFDDSRPKFDRHSRFDEPRSRYDDGKPSRFDDGKSSRFDGGRPSRFEGGRPSRFEDIGPNRFPPDERSRENEKFNRPFENDPQGSPSMGNIPPPHSSPSKPARATRWGAPEAEVEREPPSIARGSERRLHGGGLGPPYGATPDGSDFLFASIIDYNHSPANLGVPDFFEPSSIIDYTHGLNGIKVEEPLKDPWDNKSRGGKSTPHSLDRDDRGSFGGRSPWADDRSGPSRGGLRGGPTMEPSGPGGPRDSHRGMSDSSRSGLDRNYDGPDRMRGGPDRVREGRDGPDRMRDGPDRMRDGPDRMRDGPDRMRDGPDRMRDGPDRMRDGPDRMREGPDRMRDGPDRMRDGPDRMRDGPDRMRDGPDRMRDGPDRMRDGPDRMRDGPDRMRDGPDRMRDGPDRMRDGPDRMRDGPDRMRGGPDGPRGGGDRLRDGPDGPRGGRSGRWGEPDERERRRRDDTPTDRSRSPDRGRQSDRMSNRDDRRDRKEPDRERLRKDSRSPVKEVVKEVQPPALAPKQAVPIDDILISPGRSTRPPKIVIFMRGPPGSGKSYLAKLIKDKEVKNGGTAPRILSLDDYFMTDIEKEVVDTDTGRTMKKKVMEYEFEQAMEQKYRDSLNKCFRKTITDGYFPFIIIDANNDKVAYFESMANFCKARGFAHYVVELEQDVAQCIKRNIHKRSDKDIQAIVKGYEETPSSYKTLDVRSLLQEASIPEVDMEDSMDTAQSDDTQEKPESQEETKAAEQPPAEEPSQDAPPADNSTEEPDKDDLPPERTGFARFTISSKWDDLDSSCNKLDRLDGFTAARKPRPTIQDWLQISDEASFVPESSSLGSKKRVRWADVEERSKQAKMKAMGFVVGHTDWSRMMDPTSAMSKLTQTKFI